MTDQSRATVQDVARIAGVSPMTVSRVLNRHAFVRPETADRVRAAMAEVGYRRNDAARNLRSQLSFSTIGLVVGAMANPFYATVGQAVEQVARRHSALLVVASGRSDPSQERDVVETLFDRGVDGILIYPTSGDYAYLESEMVERRPVVFLGQKPDGIESDAVVIDQVSGAERAVRQLIAYGHRRIGVIGSGHADNTELNGFSDHARSRLEGYRQALSANGMPYDPTLVRMDCASVQGAGAACRDILDRPDPPTALFTLNNRMSVGVLEELGSGLAGLAMIGFGDFDLAGVVSPPITVVAHDPIEMGQRGAELLFNRIAGKDYPPRLVTLRTTLIGRGSGELPPARP